jgi:hypothetical protein
VFYIEDIEKIFLNEFYRSLGTKLTLQHQIIFTSSTTYRKGKYFELLIISGNKLFLSFFKHMLHLNLRVHESEDDIFTILKLFF